MTREVPSKSITTLSLKKSLSSNRQLFNIAHLIDRIALPRMSNTLPQPGVPQYQSVCHECARQKGQIALPADPTHFNHSMTTNCVHNHRDQIGWVSGCSRHRGTLVQDQYGYRSCQYCTQERQTGVEIPCISLRQCDDYPGDEYFQ